MPTRRFLRVKSQLLTHAPKQKHTSASKGQFQQLGEVPVAFGRECQRLTYGGNYFDVETYPPEV